MECYIHVYAKQNGGGETPPYHPFFILNNFLCILQDFYSFIDILLIFETLSLSFRLVASHTHHLQQNTILQHQIESRYKEIVVA